MLLFLKFLIILQILCFRSSARVPPHFQSEGTHRKGEHPPQKQFPDNEAKYQTVENLQQKSESPSNVVNYGFSYFVDDKEAKVFIAHEERRTIKETRGEYRVKLPDGRTQIVSYVVDAKGYRPTVKYELEGKASAVDGPISILNRNHKFGVQKQTNHDSQEAKNIFDRNEMEKRNDSSRRYSDMFNKDSQIEEKILLSNSSKEKNNREGKRKDLTPYFSPVYFPVPTSSPVVSLNLSTKHFKNNHKQYAPYNFHNDHSLKQDNLSYQQQDAKEFRHRIWAHTLPVNSDHTNLQNKFPNRKNTSTSSISIIKGGDRSVFELDSNESGSLKGLDYSYHRDPLSPLIRNKVYVPYSYPYNLA